LSDALQLNKFVENQINCVLHAAIWVFLDAAVIGLNVTDRDNPEELATLGLLLYGLD